MNTHRFAAAAAALFLCAALAAQTGYEDAIREDPTRCAGVHHSYEYIPAAETPSPAGYEAFYVSHYGRHGSRRATGQDSAYAVQLLSKAREAGMLTAEGELLLEAVKAVDADHEGMVGELTARGAREHRDIARRLYERHPGVWSASARPEVHVQSSTYSRCLVSMANFTSSLDDDAPQLKFDFVSGKKYLDLLAHDLYDSDKVQEAAQVAMFEMALSSIDSVRFIRNVFAAEPDRVRELVGSTAEFIYVIWDIACIQQCTETPGTDILTHFFTLDELCTWYKCENAAIYAMLGNSVEYGKNVCWAARGLVQDFIDRADAALADGSPTAADLRFGHDSGILPLVCLMDLVGPGDTTTIANASDIWQSYRRVPMASNLQLVFYRKAGAEPLVKIYYNEEETLVRDLAPVQGPYYSWSALKAHLERRIAEYDFE